MPMTSFGVGVKCIMTYSSVLSFKVSYARQFTRSDGPSLVLKRRVKFVKVASSNPNELGFH